MRSKSTRRALLCAAALVALLPASLASAGPAFFLPNGQGGWNAYEIETGAATLSTAFTTAAGRTFSGYESVGPSAVSGHVVTIRSQAQNDLLSIIRTGNFGNGSSMWIGLASDPAIVPGSGPASNTSGQPDAPQGQEPVSGQRGFGFKWQSGEPFTYHNWGGGEPNNFGTGETGGEMRGDGAWNDNGPPSQPGLSRQYIVEYNLNLAARPRFTGLPQGGAGFFGVRTVYNIGTLNNLRDAHAALRAGTGTVTNATSPTVNFNDPDVPGGNAAFGAGGRAPFPGQTPGVDDNDFLLIATGTIRIVTEADYTFGFSGDDGGSLRIFGANFFGKSGGGGAAGDTLEFDGLTGDSNMLGVVHLTPGDYPIEADFFERGGGAFTELYAAQGVHTDRLDGSFRLIGDTASGGLALVPEPSTFALAGIAALGLLRRRRQPNA